MSLAIHSLPQLLGHACIVQMLAITKMDEQGTLTVCTKG